MLLVLLKFVEVFARAGFVVGTSYSLGLADAGRFGLLATLVGLFAFAFNWERHVDIQRRHAASPSGIFDRAVKAALPFWGLNHALMLPFFVLAAWLMARLDAVQLILAVIIVMAEHLANQTYQMSLVSRRYWRFVSIAALRNVVAFAAVLPFILFAPSKLTLNYALFAWAGGQLACAVIVGLIWFRVSHAEPHDDGLTVRARIFAQHRASLTHFLIGGVAILMLQYDRLAVGALLPLAEVGRYFRHVLIVSFAYQFFNVASYNRVVPRIFAVARERTKAELFVPIRRELAIVWAAVLLGFFAAWGIDEATGRIISTKYHLSVPLAALLLAGALLRIVADFRGLILNAWLRERTILRCQLTGFAAGATLLVGLTHVFGIMGAGAASALSSAIYLTLITLAVRQLPERMPA